MIWFYVNKMYITNQFSCNFSWPGGYDGKYDIQQEQQLIDKPTVN